MKFLVLLLSAATAISGLVIEREALIPPKNEVYIEDVKWAGSGCKAGTVARTLSDDKQTVTLAFDSYMASIGPGIKLTESYKNCNLLLKLHVPQGWAYTIHRTQYHGFASLDAGVTATQKSIYFFAGDTKKFSAQSTFVGPYASDYHFWDTIKKETLVYCKCGASTVLNINTSLRMTSPNPAKFGGLMNTEVIEHTTKHVLGIQWRRC